MTTTTRMDRHAASVEDLRRALRELASVDPRKACIARMRLVGKLSVDEIAYCLGLERAAVEAEWQFTRAWLASEIDDPTA